MKVEIHSHTTTHSRCSRATPSELVAMAEACGYDALFITEHGKITSQDELAAVRRMSSSVKIFPGIEMSFPGDQDVLILGAEDSVYESLETPDKVLAQACADGFLTVLAHPFRWSERLPGYARTLDAIEVLTCNHPVPAQAARARDYAEANRMAGVYAADAHGLNFLNKFWIETEEPFETPQEFRRLIILGKYRNRACEMPGVRQPDYKAATMAELAPQDLPPNMAFTPSSS